VLDVASDMGILEKRGSWFSFEGEQIAQGREQTKAYLDANKEFEARLLAKIREKLATDDEKAKNDLKEKKLAAEDHKEKKPAADEPKDKK